MRVLIVNGSPAGDDSITLQTMRYIQKFHPEHEYELLNAARRIRALEADFSEAREALERADLIVFCYPVYTFLAPAQLHRFLELMQEQGVSAAGKYATQLTTSKHFYDTTAHAFLRARCADFSLRFIRGLSADMEDLLSEKGRREALAFFRHVLWSMERGICEPEPPVRTEAPPPLSEATPLQTPAEKGSGRIVVVTDLAPDNASLSGMIGRFTAAAKQECEVVNLRDFPFAGGCLGCFHCAADGTCIYRDGFDSFLREHIQSADATVYAFTIRDHSMGYRFKLHDDREFCNGHRTVTMGKPVGYLIDGRLSDEPDLRELIEARAQVGGNYLTRIAGNETDADREIDALAEELDFALRSGYRQPANFYGVGGMKIFRDLIYTMQGLMREDHRFYKRNGFYDFPQKRVGTIVGMYFAGAMMRNRKIAAKAGAKITKGMLMPYRSVVDKAKP